MGTIFKMIYDDFKLNKVILEIKYEKGYLYWDKCGEVLKEIETNFPNLKWNKTTTDLAVLNDHEKNIELTYNFEYICLIQNEVNNLNQFKEIMDGITNIVVERFKIEKFIRIGNRFWFVVPFPNMESVRETLNNNSFMKISDENLLIFGDDYKKSSSIIYIEKEDRHYRIELTGLERSDVPRNIRIDDEFNPKFGIRFDIDVVIKTKIDSDKFFPGEFIQKNKKFIENNITKFV